MVIHPMIQPNFTAKSEYKRQGRVLGLTMFRFLQTIIRGVVSQEFSGEVKCIYLPILIAISSIL